MLGHPSSEVYFSFPRRPPRQKPTVSLLNLLAMSIAVKR